MEFNDYNYDSEYNDDYSEKEIKRIVPDTSAVIEGNVEKLIKEKGLNYPEIIIPEAVIAELEHQANTQRPTGFKGLKNVKRLQELSEIGEISVSISGRRPNNFEKAGARLGEIDGLIRDVARDELALLLTSDKIQAKTAEAQGIPVIYYAQEYKSNIDLKIYKFFDDETMSVHLKENVPPMAKKGKPGHIELVRLADESFSYKQLENIAYEILEKERYDPKTYLEADMEGATVIQSRDLRISIARPPFSEGLEITAVRPVAEVNLDDYDLSEELRERLINSARGILISGSPGAGKSTFAQAIAKFYDEDLNKIVKTMESPRDLQVRDTITQYAPLEGDMENTADILLLVRPDFTIYDELRKNHDFSIFADMRLAGVGMIGVVHATRPIDAIQRIANRVDLGTIPSIVDTTIYIEDGEIAAVYENKLTVKVPTGMEERDLSRPVIEVRDFETGTLVNEIYTYGDQTIVMDIGMVERSKKEKKKNKTPVQLIAEREILKTMKRIAPKATIEVDLESDRRVNVYMSEKYIPKVIGRKGKRIAELEEDIGIKINLEPLDKAPDSFETRLAKRSKKNRKNKKRKEKNSRKLNKSQLKEYNHIIDDEDYSDDTLKDYNKNNYFDLTDDSDIYYDDGDNYSDSDVLEDDYEELFYDVFEIFPDIRKSRVELPIGKKYVGKSFDIFIEDEFLFNATVSKKGNVKVHRKLKSYGKIVSAVNSGDRIIAKVRDN
ncbi:MAG: Flp pilus assembly complex ATPase component TadA [Methanobrevibacter sp.]|nr:Flp pilus assembly complex ATPase component TadA [Methanobrevibacter sp.]